MTRRCAVLLLVLVSLIGSTSCSLFSSPSPQDAFGAFAEALGRKDGGAAGSSTDDPAAATAAITSMVNGMGANATLKVDASKPGDDDKAAKLTYSWSFGPNRELHYDATATAVQSGDDWRVHWDPTVLHPKLQSGMTFQYSDDKDFPTPVTDR
ncbi:MAG: penicillin-binding protein, partial [Actinomycetota bacterium]|nr:penicillin-binding protein [Actinomycetota bacterium]